jgi:photosynthetic reaction center H subunit
MKLGVIMGYIDVAQVTLYVFWIFFAGLIFYLRREDRREGYPLISEPSNTSKNPGFLYIPPPKVFRLSDGATVSSPDDRRADNRNHNMVKREVWPGAPVVPVGDPMLAGVGPGSYAERSDKADLMHGTPKIVPLRVATDFSLEDSEPDLVGMNVVGADGRSAGTVRDVWVDRMEVIIRYLEVETTGNRRVLLPMTFSRVKKRRGEVHVNAIMSNQFAAVPTTANADQVTLLEEDKICAYYGAGTLYANESRSEPLL